MDRHRVEVVQLLAAMLDGGDEVGVFQNREMFGHGLPRHAEAVAEFKQRLPVAGKKPIKQHAPRCVRQCLNALIHGLDNRQPNGCMTSAVVSKRGMLQNLGQRFTSPCASRRPSISRTLRATRSAHSIWPGSSVIKSCRISRLELISFLCWPCMGMV